MSARLPTKDPAESVVVAFDFLKEATSVSSPVVATPAVIWSGGGGDANPAAMVSGSAQVAGATVLQKFVGGVDLTDYALRCVANDQDGNPLVVAAILPVRAQPA